MIARLCFFLAATAVAENPIRRVVNLLQSLRQEIDDEGRKDQALFEKFTCYCTTNTEKLTHSISEGRKAIGGYEATIKELSGSNAALELEIGDAKEELADNEKAVADATSAREREQAEYQKEAAETASAVSALDKAIPAIEQGLAPADALAQVDLRGALSRDPSAQALLQARAELTDGGSSQILGILQQMRDNFKEDLAASTTSEEETAQTYEELKAAKSKQITALMTELREKETRVASQRRVLAEAKESLEDTTAALASDEELIASMKKDCAQKTQDHDVDAQSRAMEVQAIGEAVKILNEDSAVDLFKRTLPAPSFLQLGVKFLHRQPDGGFGPVKKMIMDMVGNLKKAQTDDDKQKDFCSGALHQSEADKTATDQGIKEQTRTIDEMKTEIGQLADRIQVAEQDIAALDASTKEAGEQRAKDSEFHTQTMSENAVAMELLNKAKAKLADVYAAPALVQAPQDDMRAMLGLSFLQVSDDQPSSGGYQASTAQGAGIMGLMTELIGDLKSAQQKAASEEAAAQKAYELAMEQSRTARDATGKEVVGMRGQKSSLEERVHEAKASHRTLAAEMTAIEAKIKSLHEECDFLTENYDLRKRARAQEIEAMQNSLSILSGSDFGGA